MSPHELWWLVRRTDEVWTGDKTGAHELSYFLASGRRRGARPPVLIRMGSQRALRSVPLHPALPITLLLGFDRNLRCPTVAPL